MGVGVLFSALNIILKNYFTDRMPKYRTTEGGEYYYYYALGCDVYACILPISEANLGLKEL